MKPSFRQNQRQGAQKEISSFHLFSSDLIDFNFGISFSFVDIAELLGGLLVSFHTRWAQENGKTTEKCAQVYYRQLQALIVLYLDSTFNADWSDRSLEGEAATKVIDFPEIHLFFSGNNIRNVHWGLYSPLFPPSNPPTFL